MKRIIEGLKDVLYDGIDYIMIILVIAIVAFVINWRLGGLFAVDTTDITFQEIEEPGQPDKIIDSDELGPDNELDQVHDSDERGKIGDDENHIPIEEDLNEEVAILIPTGCLPTRIGDILVNEGLVDNKDQFIKKTVELGMDTKLKSGEFIITKNSSLEEIINILTK